MKTDIKWKPNGKIPPAQTKIKVVGFTKRKVDRSSRKEFYTNWNRGCRNISTDRWKQVYVVVMGINGL